MSEEDHDLDGPSLNALYATHRDRLRRTAAGALGSSANRADVDEVVNLVVDQLGALLAAGGGSDVQDWASYLSVMTRNTVITLRTKRHREAQTQVDLDEHRPDHAQAGGGGADPTAEAVITKLVDDPADENRRAERAARFAALEPRLQRIIIGRYHDNLTFKALGVELGISGQRVGQLHDQAMRTIEGVRQRP